ncbi:single-stranded-DNA-specific exonuclease RecJ [Salirhabdus salicampi]|uniref:single-stranded-DNA-specific exonuclease RecJ n=1 Tax=Salirhabdus salicampi TaxID=476102 RepID=UPI0020C32BBD|nr:single-stranded-DNA-specific exonuclease RecJ [Salirhabdus salicampi]MCP8616979.1 single-stranded-DNA-specific exonuclease RecJ [Salirhabdus salicampi]
MLRSKANWQHKQLKDDHIDIQLPLSNLTKKLLLQRGIDNTEDARTFLAPNLKDMYDPYLFPDMKKVVERVHQAIVQGENILIFGDYDADGVTSTTVLVDTLRKLDALVDYYIPNRFTEGYGPNEEAFKQAKQAGVSLIITVDTGIAAVHEAKVAKQLGIDLIITDHHEAQEELPETFGTIHPKLANDYPFDELAGVGVAFKLAHALLGEFPYHLLDLAAIGTVADLVPLKSENRILVAHGLKALTNTKRPGLTALKEICKISGDVTEEHIGFGIGPRLNAVGRLQDATLAVELLLEQDLDSAKHIAAEVQSLNQKRQKIVSDITEEAREMIKTNCYDQDSVIVLAKEDWNPGVLGIVASKIVNEFQRPTIVLGIDKEKGEAKGSARSIERFDMFENCMELRHLFLHFGGHAQAAGMTLRLDQIEQLREELNTLAEQKLTANDFLPIISVDMKIDLTDITEQAIQEVGKLGPFGMGNPKPIFEVSESPDDIRQIGAKSDHLKFFFQKDSTTVDIVGFGMGDLAPRIAPQSNVTAVGELSINEWNGKKRLQMMLKDVKIDHWQLFDYRGSNHLHKQLHHLSADDYIGLYFRSQNVSIGDVQLLSNQEWVATDIATLSKCKGILILDLPEQIEDLEQVLHHYFPDEIYVCFKPTTDSFGQSPNREHFKWFYGFMLKQKQLNLNVHRQRLMKAKGWSSELLDFIIEVFLELQFVKMNDGVLHIHPNPEKRDLTESNVYQRKMKELTAEKELYFSSYRQLNEWFEQYRSFTENKEEVLHGL